jgi:simple sugar transport system permease protein
MLDTLFSMLTQSLNFSTPIIIAGLGGLFSERSGVVNIALQGLMMVGGFAGATITVLLEPLFSINIAPWIGILVGMLSGALLSLIHAYLSVNIGADQVISGTGINLLAIGLTVYLAEIIFGQQRTETFRTGFSKETIPLLSRIPIIGDIFFTNIYSTVFLGFLLVAITWFVVYKTAFGLRLRATGENPHAADSMGINVYKMRYIGVILSGALAGLAGAIMILTLDTQYTVTSIPGTGFIALAALIFGKWKPFGLMWASLFFGFSVMLRLYATDVPVISNLPLEFFSALPYLVTVIALVVFSSRDVGPKAAGEPYDKGKR